MDSTIDTTKERLNVLDQPPTSHASLILNGVFNGATIAGLPFAAYDFSHKISGAAPTHSLTKLTVFATMTGAAVGAWFGAREAKNLTTYQTAVSEEIRKLRADVDAHAQAHHGRA